jgi:hypothetical protein
MNKPLMNVHEKAADEERYLRAHEHDFPCAGCAQQENFFLSKDVFPFRPIGGEATHFREAMRPFCDAKL